MTYTSEYPPFYVTVDIVVLSVVERRLCALVVRRGSAPFEGAWALPGGFVDPDEDLEQAARRELDEETAVPGVERLEQLGAYGDPDRDPRGRIVSVAWLAAVPAGPQVQGGSDAASAQWRPLAQLDDEELAFDHHRILRDAVRRARAEVSRTSWATAFVDEEFTLADLRGVYEAVWGGPVDAEAFDRAATAAGFIEPVEEGRQRGPGQPAAVYRRRPGADELDPPLTRSALC
jgi:8-oxo-dGTP diphosphatase